MYMYIYLCGLGVDVCLYMCVWEKGEGKCGWVGMLVFMCLYVCVWVDVCVYVWGLGVCVGDWVGMCVYVCVNV